MNRHLEELIELSKLDRAIDDFNPVVEKLQSKLDRKRDKKEEIEKLKLDLEATIQETKVKISSFESQIKVLKEQLNSSAKREKLVKSEKELKALRTESELAKEGYILLFNEGGLGFGFKLFLARIRSKEGINGLGGI